MLRRADLAVRPFSRVRLSTFLLTGDGQQTTHDTLDNRHGRKSRGRQRGRVPPEFGVVKGANANCPHPDFVMFRNFKQNFKK